MEKRAPIVFLFVVAALKLTAQTGGGNLQFVENKGQWDKQVSFRASIGSGSFFLQKKGFTVLLHDPAELKRLRGHLAGSKGGARSGALNRSKSGAQGAGSDSVLHSHAYRVSFRDASDEVQIIPDKLLPTYNNYFIGNDPTKWASSCRIFQGVTYKNIYPNIDLRYYTNNGVLKYDLIVHPGGDPDKIIMEYEGVDRLTVKNNELQIKTSVGMAKEESPASYQLMDSGRKEVECGFFKAAENIIRFRIRNYDATKTLVIDPTLVFASFTGSTADNWGFTATYGPDGSLFAGGIVLGDGFPVSPGAFLQSFQGGVWDVGLIKFDPTGSQRLFGTYLGGSSNEYPHSLVVDPQGNLVVFGRTESLDFPATTFGPGGGRDIYVTKFNATGTGLIGSLRIGGTKDDGINIEDQDESQPEILDTQSMIRNYGDWSRGEVILDGSNNIYVASCTQSVDFPVAGSVFQPTFGGGGPYNQDGVVIKINPTCTSVIFSSFLGGSNDDAALVMDINPISGDLYVGGATLSTNFPGVQSTALQSTLQGFIDGFVSEISSDGSTLKATTYLGTVGYNMIYGVKFDRFGFPYVMGTTTGTWPVINATWSVPGSRQFVSKLQPDLSAFIYSTTFGSMNAPSPNISPVAFLVDRCQNVYVSGWGSFYALIKPDPYDLAGTTGMPATPDAIKPTTDGRDFYFIVIKRDATGLLYGSFYGQNDPPNGSTLSEHVDGGTSRYDKNGVIYQAICANCNSGTTIWPTTPGSWATLNGARSFGGCNLASVKIAFNFAGVAANIKSLINGQYDSMGCVPLGVTFEDTIQNAKTYVWSFGDGSPDTTTTSYQALHTYSQTGIYLVRLIAIDSSTCNIADTAYTHIIARNDRALLSFTSLKLQPCQSLSYQFSNTSMAPAGKPFTDSSFIWDFGDGTRIVSGTASVNHSFASAGTYTIKLVLIDTNYCNYPDSVSQTLSVSPIVKAQFITPAAGCVPYNAVFTNTSAGGQQYFWNFGDGTTSSQASPTHLYTNTGTYTVSLVVVDSNTCNITDSTSATITVSDKPHAAFTTTPVPAAPNTFTIFHNSSTGGSVYKWLFGDGDTAVTTNLDTVSHLYNKTGTYNACLIVFNQYQCTDTACEPVQAIVNPLVDVPNAFTPGRFGENAIVKVRGFGISQMIFRIYNRWGQEVFESTDQNLGWDGTFKGSPQPMDVYAYVLEVEFVDGSKASKKGDITLLR